MEVTQSSDGLHLFKRQREIFILRGKILKIKLPVYLNHAPMELVRNNFPNEMQYALKVLK